MPSKRPFATDEQLLALAERYPTPFFLYDEAGIRATLRELFNAFAWNPGFKEYFAVKANPNPALISILREYGCGLDCASDTELILAETMGITGHDVMLSSNETPDATYAHAHCMGAIVNLDDATQFDHYRRATGDFGSAMSVRFNPGGSFSVAGNVQGMPEESKFGMTRAQLIATLRSLAEAGVATLGIHAFLASNMLDDAYYPTLARTLFALARDVAYETGIQVGFINLSGGVGIPYAPEEKRCNIAAIGDGVRQAFEEILVPAGMRDVAIYTELGRYILGPHGGIVTRVLGEKHTYRDYLGVDASSADLIRPMMYGAYHHMSVIGKTDASEVHTYDVVGGLCEGGDRLARARELPLTHEGDLIFIHDTGAHGHAMGMNYNGHLRAAEVLLHHDGSDRLIRRAETVADYFATLDVLGDSFIQAS